MSCAKIQFPGSYNSRFQLSTDQSKLNILIRFPYTLLLVKSINRSILIRQVYTDKTGLAVVFVML